MASIIGVNELQHTNGTTAATIDSSGRIMRSVIPSFFAYRGTGDATDQNYTESTKVTFDAERYDNGNCFDLPNSKFIVPVTGLYQINWQVRTSNSASASSVFSPLHLNGNAHWGNNLYLYADVNDPQAGNNNSPNCAVTIELTADDELEVFIRTSGDSLSKVNGAGTFFSGFLIG